MCNLVCTHAQPPLGGSKSSSLQECRMSRTTGSGCAVMLLVINFGRLGININININRVWFPILLVVSRMGEGGGGFTCSRTRERPFKDRETGSTLPSRVSPFILDTQAESGAYSRDPPRFPRRRPFSYTVKRHRAGPECIGSHKCVPMGFTAVNPPAQGQ